MIPVRKSYLPGRKTLYVNDDGEISRGFCLIENLVQINILEASAQADAKNNVYNMALGDRTTLNTLFDALKTILGECGLTYDKSPIYRGFRVGDVCHPHSDISKAKDMLGYEPDFRIYDGIGKAMPWYVAKLSD